MDIVGNGKDIVEADIVSQKRLSNGWLIVAIFEITVLVDSLATTTTTEHHGADRLLQVLGQFAPTQRPMSAVPPFCDP